MVQIASVALSSRHIAVVMGLIATGFIVSTIVLAVDNSDLRDSLSEAQLKLDFMEGLLASTPAPNYPPTEPPTSSEIIETSSVITPTASSTTDPGTTKTTGMGTSPITSEPTTTTDRAPGFGC